METRSKLKTILAVVMSILVIVVVIQNTETVETRLLFITVSMPRAVLLFLTALVGVVIGLLAALRMRPKDKPK